MDAGGCRLCAGVAGSGGTCLIHPMHRVSPNQGAWWLWHMPGTLQHNALTEVVRTETRARRQSVQVQRARPLRHTCTAPGTLTYSVMDQARASPNHANQKRKDSGPGRCGSRPRRQALRVPTCGHADLRPNSGCEHCSHTPYKGGPSLHPQIRKGLFAFSVVCAQGQVDRPFRHQ